MQLGGGPSYILLGTIGDTREDRRLAMKGCPASKSFVHEGYRSGAVQVMPRLMCLCAVSAFRLV